jgi:hypothetical protein
VPGIDLAADGDCEALHGVVLSQIEGRCRAPFERQIGGTPVGDEVIVERLAEGAGKETQSEQNIDSDDDAAIASQALTIEWQRYRPACHVK